MNSPQHSKPAIIFLGIACLAIAMEAVAQQHEIRQPVLLTNTQIDSNVVPTGCEGACSRKTCCRELVCCPVRVEKEAKKHCWNVKAKEVCIPGFRWPWEKCQATKPRCGDCCGTGCEACKPKCGRVRCINVLEKHEYTCKTCGYEWKVKRVCTDRCQRDSSDCCPECGSKRCD